MSQSRLIIICGLPGSGKTTLAKMLEAKLNAVRFCADEWMSALSIGIYDEARREKIEKLQWELCRQLLTLGAMIIIEWGPGADRNATNCVLARVRSVRL
jgi:predicted kinase